MQILKHLRPVVQLDIQFFTQYVVDVYLLVMPLIIAVICYWTMCH